MTLMDKYYGKQSALDRNNTPSSKCANANIKTMRNTNGLNQFLRE